MKISTINTKRIEILRDKLNYQLNRKLIGELDPALIAGGIAAWKEPQIITILSKTMVACG